MKTLLSFLFIALTFTIQAQTFEGTLHWSIKSDITDPKMKAQMEKAQKQMSDPANQAKMKQMQEQMNSPQMKAMLESNPQMKAQMESALKMMQGGDMSSMIPKSLTVKIKGNNSISKMDGGIMAAEVLYLGDKQQSYLLDREGKTYIVTSADENERTTSKPVVTKTSETTKILNHLCTKYIVEVKSDKGATIHQIFWTTNEIKGLDLKSLSKQGLGKGSNSFYYEGVEGTPLKMELTTPQMVMVMEATEIKKETLPASEFSIPAGFTETKGFGR
jgi:3-phenylpropionate/cinnamic acid dioxygenase small subunit